MKSSTINWIVIAVSLLISLAATKLLGEISYTAMIMIGTATILEPLIHWLRVRKREKEYLGSTDWDSRMKRYSWMMWVSIAIAITLLITTRDYGLIVVGTIWVMIISFLEYRRLNSPLKVYENGIYVYGIYVRPDEIELVEFREGFISFKAGYGLVRPKVEVEGDEGAKLLVSVIQDEYSLEME